MKLTMKSLASSNGSLGRAIESSKSLSLIGYAGGGGGLANAAPCPYKSLVRASLAATSGLGFQSQ